ncbi:MAG: NADPH-nitrite reductase [Thermodesulfobacteriota bacterium]|nr:MAG: NADPH-nitrite reductase [Thermodesulfobacteriota bacterium]
MKNMEKREKLVVVGGGMSAAAFVEEVVKLDPERYEITVFSGEKHLSYNRVLLSHILTGEKAIDDILLHDDGWYEDKGIRLRVGCMVSEIKRGSRSVVGEDGSVEKYNKLVLSTGSRPVILPIPGVDKSGVVSFRNIEDSERIRRILDEGGKKAVVIGGGLLGLEAAWGLKDIGADVTVVHLMDRLMEKQLDSTAAGFLKQDISDLGIKVLLGMKTVEITGDESVKGVRFADGSEVDADIVVMSVGITPNTALAASSGIYCQKGIVVSDTMQTYDPAVYAVGECVEHRGKTFGLVASVFEQARVLANHLAGDCRLIFKDRPTSTTLKVPGINLYSAGVVEHGAGADTIEYIDRGSRHYKNLIIEDNIVKGIVLYGDTGDGPTLFGHLLNCDDIGDKRGRLLLGGPVGAEAFSIDEIPDDTVVCGCNGVTKGTIVEAIETKGLFTREDVAEATKASSSCGGCSSMVERILESVLGSDFSIREGAASLCACTTYSRDDIIKNIREKGLKSVMEVMETLGWESVGCDTCRPAINYYVSMVWPAAAENDLSSRLINERVHANIQKDGTFSVVPRVYGGAVTPDELKRIADAAVKYKVPLVKITGGQRIDLLGVKREDLKGVWKDIGMPSGYAYGKALRTVKTCVGEGFCRYGTQDSMGLGIRLEKRLEGLWTPAKVKLGVSGCPRNCAETSIKDIGITGISGGWEIHVGGSGGIELAAGELLVTVKTGEEALEIVSAFIQFYREDADYGERTFKWVRRKGLKGIKEAVLEDGEARKGLLKRLEEALGTVKDPWTGGKKGP